MKNEAQMRPFPDNLFYDLHTAPPFEQPDDFIGTLMYILRTITTPRDAKAMILRYQNGLNYDDIGNALEVTKQRAHAMIQDTLGKITGDHIEMLKKGMKRYMESMLESRMEELTTTLEESERESIRVKAYQDGYETGFSDASTKKISNPANQDAIKDIEVKTLGLSVRTYNACVRNNLLTIKDILSCGDEIVNCVSFGEKCFREIAEALASFKVNVASYFPRTIIKYGLGEQDE